MSSNSIEEWKHRASYILYGVEFTVGGPMTSLKIGGERIDMENKAEIYAMAPFGYSSEPFYSRVRGFPRRIECPRGIDVIERLYITGYMLSSFFADNDDAHILRVESEASKQKAGPAWVLDKLHEYIAWPIAGQNSAFKKMLEAYNTTLDGAADFYYIYIDGLVVFDTVESLAEVLHHVFWKIACLSDNEDAAATAFDMLRSWQGIHLYISKSFLEGTTPERAAFLLDRIDAWKNESPSCMEGEMEL